MNIFTADLANGDFAVACTDTHNSWYDTFMVNRSIIGDGDIILHNMCNNEICRLYSTAESLEILLSGSR